MFSCDFCEISKNAFFTEHLRKTASVLCKDVVKRTEAALQMSS